MGQKMADIRELLRIASVEVPGSWVNRADLERFYDLTVDVAQSLHTFQTMLAVYPFIIVSRFFKAFSFQPRLALVTATLSEAATDILHFGIVFGSVFIVY